MNKDVDYFDILSRPSVRPKYKMDEELRLQFRKKTVKKKKKVQKIVETEADKLRKLEIKAAKSEIYQLRTTGESERKAQTEIAIKNRQEELMYSKRVLSNEGYIKK